MNEFSFLITDEVDLKYTLRGYGPLAGYSLTVQFKDLFTEGYVHTGTIVASSFATFPKGAGVRLTRSDNEVFVIDSF